MKIQSVKKYKPPAYPTQSYLHAHPELLRLVPQRWQGNRIVLTALSAAALLITSCDLTSSDEPDAKYSHRVAPFFTHGNGQGGGGGAVGDNSVYLTEAEAFAIIRNEALAGGLNFDSSGHTVNHVWIPFTTANSDLSNRIKSRFDSVGIEDFTTFFSGNLGLDGFDSLHNSACEFVSYEDFSQWQNADWPGPSTLSSVDLMTTAKRLRESLRIHGTEPFTAVFYDPATEYTVSEDSTRAISDQQLRAQVRDFIQWLKTEGII